MTQRRALRRAEQVVPTPTLRITAGDLAGTVIPVDVETGTLGRRPTNTYVVAEPTVSRLHARLSRAGGAVVVTDLDSTAGTRLNGIRLAGPAVLHHGDELRFGALRAVFEDPRELVLDESDTQDLDLGGVSERALSPRHRQVLELIGQGLTNRQIGSRLDITERTVKDYASEIYRTLGVSNRAGAVGQAVARGLIDGLDPEAA